MASVEPVGHDRLHLPRPVPGPGAAPPPGSERGDRADLQRDRPTVGGLVRTRVRSGACAGLVGVQTSPSSTRSALPPPETDSPETMTNRKSNWSTGCATNPQVKRSPRCVFGHCVLHTCSSVQPQSKQPHRTEKPHLKSLLAPGTTAGRTPAPHGRVHPEHPTPYPRGPTRVPAARTLPHPPDTGAAPRTNVAVAYAAAFVTSGNSDSQTSSVGCGRAPPLIRHHRHARPRSLSEPDDAIAQHGRYRPYVRRCDRSAAEYPAVRTPRPGRSAGAGGPSERSQQLLRYGR